MSQKKKFYSKSYEIRLKLLKPNFHLRPFLCGFTKKYGTDAKHLQQKLNNSTTIPQSKIVRHEKLGLHFDCECSNQSGFFL